MNANQKNCPLCDRIANFENRDRKNQQYFHCECCKDFALIGRTKREHLNEDKKRELSKLSASLNDDQLLQIYFDEHEIKSRVVNL